MRNCIIKLTSRMGQDPQVFRAYAKAMVPGGREEPLGVSASTTGNTEFGAITCAAKAFKKYSTIASRYGLNRIEDGIQLKPTDQTGVWEASLTL